MPKVKSTRHEVTSQPENKDQSNVQLESNTTNTATNSNPDPLVQDYKLHFELTDLETTKPSINDGERPSSFETGRDDPVSLKLASRDAYPTPPRRSRDRQVPGADNDGEGEPDFAFNTGHIDASYDPALLDEPHPNQSELSNAQRDHFDGSSTYIIPPTHPERSSESKYISFSRLAIADSSKCRTTTISTTTVRPCLDLQINSNRIVS